MTERFQSKWMDVISGVPRYGSDKSDKRASGTSGTPLVSPPENHRGASGTSGTPLPGPSKNHKDIDADDPATWPPYMRCMLEDSLAGGGKGLDRRQVEAEVAFWRNADADGWQLFTADDREK